MFHGDPTFKSPSQKVSVDLELLGMEARSILRSIRTEHAKLTQAESVAQSDLHYFRARYNYYKLSLLRLDEGEKQMLEPVLKLLKTSIIAAERVSFESVQEEEPAPFLAAVERKSVQSEPAPVRSSDQAERATEKTKAASSAMALQSLEAKTGLEAIESELQLVRLALSGEINPQAKTVLAQSIDRVIDKIKKLNS